MIVVKEILLQNGMVVFVDDEDYERLNAYKWRIYKEKSAITIETTIDRKTRKLGNVIFDIKNTNQVVVHINGDRLDFQKTNLKLISKSEMNLYKKGNVKSTSKYKGVSWSKRDNKWRAQIQSKGKTIHLGAYLDEDEAAEAYNNAALIFHGKNAYQNKIGENNNSCGVETIIPTKKARSMFRGDKKLSSEYRGVCWSEKSNKFTAYFNRMYLGVFSDEIVAAKVRDQKAYELHGDKAILNFPQNINEYKNSLSGATETSI